VFHVIGSLFKNSHHFYSLFITDTTRQPRQNEKEGKSYYFIDVPTFEKMISNDEFAEYVQFSGNYYGTRYNGILIERVIKLNSMSYLVGKN